MNDYPAGTTSHIALPSTAASIGIITASMILGAIIERGKGIKLDAVKRRADFCVTDKIIAEVMGLVLWQTLAEAPGATFTMQEVSPEILNTINEEFETAVCGLIAKMRRLSNQPAAQN